MSLILDAVKKAQQLWLKELEGVNFSKGPCREREKNRKRKKYFLIFKISGLSMLLLFFFMGSNLLSLLTFHKRQEVASLEKKELPTNTGTKNELREPSKEEVLPLQVEKPRSSTKPFNKEKREELPVKKRVGQEMIKRVKTDIFSVQSGAFSSKKNAQTLVESLKTSGIKCSIYEMDNIYKVSCGEFLQESDAYLFKRKLLTLGHKGVFVKTLANESSKTMEADRVAKQFLQRGATPPGKISTKPVEVSKKIVPKRELTIPPLGSQKKETPSTKPIDSEHAVLTYFNMGVDFYRQLEISKAIQAYQKVIELEPSYVEAYNNLGIIYQDIGDFDRAFGAYQKAIKINPRYEKAYNNLGILLFLNDRYEESMEAFQKALAINSSNIETHINLGILFKKQGQFEKAIECYQKALAINPFHGETHYNIGLLYEQLENFKLAIGHYQKFIQLTSKTHPDLVSKVQRHLDYLIAIKGGKGK